MEISRKARERAEIIAIAAIFVLAVALRIVSARDAEYTLVWDALGYKEMAVRLINEGVYGYYDGAPDAYVTPAYPLFVALVFKIFGESVFSVQCVQAIVSTLTGFIAYLFLRRYFSRAAGIATFAIMAIYPPFVGASVSLLTECLYMFFLIIWFVLQYAVLYDCRISSRVRIALSAASGIALAMTVLTRPAALALVLLPLASASVRIIKGKLSVKTALAHAGAFVGAALILFLPWWIRNLATLGEFIPLCSQGGNAFLYGTYPGMENVDAYVEAGTESALAIERLRIGFTTEPLKYLWWYTGGKFIWLFRSAWYYLPGPTKFPYLNWYVSGMHAAVVILGWLSCIYGLVKPKMRIISAAAIVLTAMQLFVVPEDRYAFGALHFLVMLIAIAGTDLVKCIISRSKKTHA